MPFCVSVFVCVSRRKEGSKTKKKCNPSLNCLQSPHPMSTPLFTHNGATFVCVAHATAMCRPCIAPHRVKKARTTSAKQPHGYSRGRISGEHFKTKIVKTWWSQKHAAADLGVKKGTVSACIVRGRGLCQGWRLTRVVTVAEHDDVCCPAQVADDRDDDAGTPNLTKVARVLATLSASPPQEQADIAKPVPIKRPFCIDFN